MTHRIIWLTLGTVALASCTAILGGVPTTGGTGGSGGASSTKAAGPGSGGGVGGKRSANGGSGGTGIGGSGGAGGGQVCANKGEACGSSKPCCGSLTCDAQGTCVATAGSSSSGAMNCISCADALNGVMGQLCTESQSKLTALTNCACSPNSCVQTCGQACLNHGLPSLSCQQCALNACPTQASACENDNGTCNSCNQMLNAGDIDPNDACAGTARDDFSALFNCVCSSMSACGQSCSSFCGGMGLSPDCSNCVSAMTGPCFNEYKACGSN